MKPDNPRFRLVEGLRVAATQAERLGARIEVIDVTEDNRVRVIRADPAGAREIADRLERRWTS